MSDLMLDVDQAGELKAAFRREGPWTNAQIKMLTERKGLLRKFHEVLLGNAEINFLFTLINCDLDPYLPYKDWRVRAHKRIGMFSVDPKEIVLFPVGGNFGNIIIKDLADEYLKLPVLNANVLDHLMNRPYLVPDEWEDKKILFAGTIYESEQSGANIRYLRYWKRQSRPDNPYPYDAQFDTPFNLFGDDCFLALRK